MIYDYCALFDSISLALRRDPRIRLCELSVQLRVERHSVERAVRLQTGQNFRALKRSLMFDRACDLLTHKPSCSIKEIAFSLGYRSPRSLARFIRALSGETPKALRRSWVKQGKANP